MVNESVGAKPAAARSLAAEEDAGGGVPPPSILRPEWSAKTRKAGSGMTLVELMIALAILIIGIVGLVNSLAYIQKAVQASKNKTLASHLAQEKMQILKNMPYYQVIATSSPVHNTTDFAPESLDYDAGYFPPDEITEGGVSYTRYTYVQAVKEDSGVLTTLAPNIPDTGMKRITITMVWGRGSGGKRKLTVRGVMANPDTVLANVVFNGIVQTTSSVAIGGAMVQLVEGVGWGDTTNSSGQYNFNATPGSYTLMASATGYYSGRLPVVIPAGATRTNNLSLTKIATGSIKGYPWLTDHLVISQVVGSTTNASVTPHYDQEYVEVFNPTTYTWTMNGNIGLKFQGASDPSKKTILIDYLRSAVLSGGYYLFANTGNIVAGGVSVTADAVWASGNFGFPYFAAQGNIIPVDGDGGIGTVENSGAIELYKVSDGTTLDKVGWRKSGYFAPFYENTPIQTAGLTPNELYARRTSTSDSSGVNVSFGPAYDSNNNNIDFYDYSSAIGLPPHNSLSGGKTVISGTPAAGALVTASDGLSSSTEAWLSGTPPYAYFSLVDVATGSWTVLISSGAYSLEKATVTIPSAGSVYTFVNTTTFLTTASTDGLITGRITNALGVPLPGIVVAPGGVTTDSDGRYRLRAASGMANVTANPTVGGTSLYVTLSSNTIPVETGKVHAGVDFVLYQGGRVSGFVTGDGTNGLSGIAVVILDANSIAQDQQVSDANGRFSSVVLSTGYYIVQPVIGAIAKSSPVSSTTTLLATAPNQFSSTFTISGALGYITGSVTYGGNPIKTGVLIVVTTATLSGTPPVPPDLSTASLAGTPYYVVSSVENGTYKVAVRNSVTPPYNVYAYYPLSVSAASDAVIYSAKTAGVSVTAGNTHSGVDFSWP